MSSPDLMTANESPSSYNNSELLKHFIPLIYITEVIGLVAVILILTWSLNYIEGMIEFSSESELGWHPFLMSLGLIYLSGNAILIFRILREWPAKRLKLIHAWIHGIVLILAIIGLFLIIDYHYKKDMNNFYSVHSWIGLITVALFIIQLSLGFSAFMYPVFGQLTRSYLLPYHVYLGKAILAMAIVAAATGINELAIFKIQKNYQNLPPRAIILNLSSILFILFGVLVLYITNKTHYKRQARPEDIAPTEIISPHSSTPQSK